jgi:subtilase family serine protease
MSRLRKLRRQIQRNQITAGRKSACMLETLEPRLLLAADLQVDAFGPDMFGPYDWNTTLDLTADVINAGDTAATGTATVKFYLSDDNTLEVGTDVELTENFTVVDLGIGAVSNNTHTVTLPASGTDGDKFLFMAVDSEDAIVEDNETNNTNALWIPVGSFGPVTGIDLAAKPADLPDVIDLVWGETYPACADAFNDGDTSAGAFTIDIVLSTDPMFDAGDTSILAAPVDISGGLNSQTETANDADVTLPASGFSDGQYYVLVVADSTSYDTGGQVTEAYESNNVAPQMINVVTTPTLSSGVDLVGVELDLFDDTGSLEWGQTYELDADVYNIGDTAATAFDISIAVSADQTYSVLSGDDQVVGVIQVNALNSTEFSYNPTYITLPPVGTFSDGPYYLVMNVDSGDVFTETDETDNILTCPITVTAPAPTSGADLVIDNAFIDMMGDPIDWNDTLDADVDLSNIGDAEATGTATTKFYLSDNKTLEIGTDTELTGNFTTVNLGAGANSNGNNVTITMPASGTDGDYYILVMVDSEDAIVEGDETNNTWMMPITVGDITAMTGVIDLVSSELNGPSGPDPLLPNIDFIWGNTYTVPVDVYNAGDTNAGAFTVSVVLEHGPGPEIGGSQYVLATLPIASLNAAAESVNDVNVTLPTPGIFSDGDYHLTILIDSVNMDSGGEVTEAFEINNMFGQPIHVVTTPTLSAGVDLKNVDFFLDVEDPNALTWGETYEIDADVYNIGDANATAFDVLIALSADQVYDGGDTDLKTLNISAGLNSTELSLNTTTITLPTPGTIGDGNYYLLMISDSGDVFTEANETDNLIDIPIAVGSPVDLVADEIGLPGSLDLKWGQAYEFAADAKNVGNTDAGAFDMVLAISPDQNYDPGTDQVLATVNVSGVLAGEDTINDAAVTLPNAGEIFGGHTYADGDYYLILVVDNGDAVTEALEDNNISIEPVKIVTTSSLAGIDLAAFEFDLEIDGQPEDGVPTLAWSDTYNDSIEFELYNFGDTDAGSFDVTVRLSDDPVYDGTDSEIGTYNVTSVGSLALTFEYMSISMPAPGTDGVYYVVAKLDSADAVTETDETNNVLPPITVQVGTPAAGIDLIPAEFSVDDSGPYEWGDTLNLVADVYNAGDTDATAFAIKIYLSPDDTPDPAEEIANLNINALNAGAFIPNDLPVNLPAPGTLTDGTYKLIMVVDTETAVSETDETNNSWIIPIDVSGPTYDLELASPLLLPPAPVDILWNTQYHLPLDLVNNSDVVNPDAVVTVVISDDNAFDTNDDVLYTGTFLGVQPNDKFFLDADITLPNAGDTYFGGTYADGAWYIIAFVDSAEAIPESDETNNTVVQTVTIYAVNDLAAGVDLVPLHIDISMPEFDGTMGWAQHAPIKLDIYNDGDTAADPFDITLVLSTDTTYDAGDTVLTSWSQGELLSDEIAPADAFINLPEAGALADGDYYIIAKLDSADVITESDDANNTIATEAIAISLSSGTDLLTNMFALDVMGPYVWGQTLDVQADLRNAGDTDATGPFTVKIFFNNADTLDGSETELDTFDIASLAAGAQSQNARTLTLPGTGTDGNYFLIMQIDSADAVSESDELNNLFVMPIPLGTSDLDLQIADFSWPTELIFEAGGFYPLTTSILNNGTGTAFNLETRVVLSTDNTFDAADTVVASRFIGALGPGATDTQDMNVNLPPDLTEGTYYLALITDPENLFHESNETNNLQSAQIQVTVPQADLEVSLLNIPPGPFFSGDMIPIDAQINNPSNVDIPDYTWQVVLSTDETFDAADTVLISLNAAAPPFSNNPQFTDILLPADLAEGDYYLAVLADPENLITETLEDNNSLSVLIHVTPAQSDLTVSNFNVPPEPFFVGGMFPIINEVHNMAPFPADPCTVTFVLSTDANIDLTDLVVGQRELPALAPDIRDEQFTDIIIPDDGTVTPGDYYLGMIVDSAQQVTELDENNNILSVPVIIEPPQIDIVVSFFNPYTPGPFFWGDTVGLTADVRNDGFHPAPASSAQILLSQDDLPDANDIVLHTLAVDPLMPGMLIPNDLNLNLPTEDQGLTDGEYHLIMVVDSDNAVEEFNEDNNSWTVPIYVETPVPPPIDLVAPMGPPPPQPMEWMWGQTYPLPADAFNQSDGPAFNFDITVVLSPDDIYDPADQLLGSVHIDELAPWQDSFNDLDVTLDESGVHPDGLYHIITFVDSADTVEEIDENNNISFMPVNIFTPNLVQGVDLQIMEYFLEEGGNLGWGQTYEVVADLFNSGDSDAAPFDITVALSTDPELDLQQDTIVGTLSLNGLAAGEMSINDITITLPVEGTLPNGPYRLILALDSGKVIDETDEENNLMDLIINIGQSGADLALMDMMMPFDAAWGDQINIDAMVENWGSETVGPVAVNFYRSDDWNWDPADELLTSATINSIPGGTNVMTSAQFTLPAEGADGEMLHIIGVVDPENLIPEFDEEFNNRQIRDLFVGTPELPNLLAWPMIMFDPQHPDPDWGDTLNLDVMLDNMSNVPVEAFTVKYYLSQDETVDTSDLSLGRSDLTGMQPWEHQQINGVSLVLPGASPDDTVQEWFILAMADSADVIEEFDENDNTGWNPIYIGSKPADLTGWMAISPLNPPDLFWGDPLTLDVQIDNWGASDAGPFDVSYYFSLDPEISPDDIPAGTQTIDLVAAESSTDLLPYTVTLPADPLDPNGNMIFILAHIDANDAVAEIDEFNNYMGDWYGPEVAASDLVAFYADAGFQAFWSDELTTNEITIQYGLGNFGNQDAPDVQIDFLLVPIDGDPAQAFPLGSLVIPMMGAGMDHNDQITLALPTPADVPFIQPGMDDGTFMLLMQVDSQNIIPEIFEDNNSFTSPLRLEALHGFIEVTDSFNDPYDRMFDFGPVLSGEPINAFFEVVNHGMGPLNITDIVSDNPDFNVIIPAGVALPITLSPQEMISFELNFASELEGYQQAVISIHNDDPGLDVVQLNAWADVAGAPIDLTIDSIDAPPAVHWNEPINLNLSISNLAAGDAAGEAFLDIILSDTPDEFGMVFHLASMPIAPLLAGSTIDQQIEVFLPEFSPFGYGGQFFIQAMIHPTDADFEENFMNNQLAQPIEITSQAIGKPDLTFTWFSMPPEAAWGMEMPVDLGLRNIGLADAESFTIRYYLSQNDILESKDELLSEINVPGLSADSEMVQPIMVMLSPDGDSDGIHFLIVEIDADNVVDEEFEENNHVFARFHLSSGPSLDLVPHALNLPPEIVLGEEFDIELLVANLGEEPAEGVRVEFFLSQNDQASGEFFDMFIGSMMLDALPASPTGEPVPFTFTTMLPHGMIMPDAQFTIEAYIDADQMFEEIDEWNNLIVSAPLMASAGELDLVADLINPPAEATWGESFNVILTVSNQGQIDAAPFFIDVLLSEDNVLDDSDFYLTSDMIYGLPAAEGFNSIPLTFEVFLPEFLPSGDGSYTLFVNIDGPNFVPETDEQNNLLAAPIEITGTPDLAVFFEQVPFTSNFDQTITVTDIVENWGTSNVDQSFTVKYYLSVDSFFDTQDVELGSRTASSLAAGAEDQADTEFMLTQPVDWPDEGLFHLIAVVDPADEIAETAEEFIPVGEMQGNNVVWMPIEIISDGMPDLVVDAVTSMTDAAEWDQPVWVQYQFNNLGADDADEFVATFFLSDNLSITAKDYELGQITIPALTAQTQLEDVAEFMLPAESPFGTDGDFYIGVRVDTEGQIPEINEENNLAVTNDTLTVGTVINVDLMAAYLDCPPDAIPGEPLGIYYEIYNAGSSASTAFDIEFYLTPMNDDSEILLGVESFAALGAEAFQGNIADFTLPQSLDQSIGQTFFVTMKVNPAALADPETADTPEKFYDNNTLTALNPLAIIDPIHIDASLANLTADPDANWGDAISAQVEVQTPDSIIDPIHVVFYLSQTGDPADAFELAGASVDLSAGPVNVQLDLILPENSPFGRDGNFQIIALVDPDNLIPESNEFNNALAAPINIGSGKADLVALSISTDPRAAAGDTIEVYNDIENVGSETAANFDIYFYLTDTAATLDPDNDTLLGMRHVTSLPAGTVNWNLADLNLPGNLPDGDYYVAMTVDKFDDVEETSENNNTSISYQPLKVKTINVDPDEYEPNNSANLATTLTIDEQGIMQTISASLHDNNDLDYYTLATPANASGFLRVDLIPDELLNAALMIYDNSDALIGGADNDPAYGGEEMFNTFNLAPGRTYTLLVKPMGESFGAYNLDLELGLGAAGDPYEPNDTIDTACYLGTSNAMLHDASIHLGDDIDYYQFAIPATSTGQVVIDVTSAPTLDAVLQIFDAQENLIASADSFGVGATESLLLEGTVGENYYARVSAWAESTGGYELDLAFTPAQLPDNYEPNDEQTTAHDLGAEPASLTSPGVHNPDDIDFYALTIPKGFTQIEIMVHPSNGLDAAVSLYDSAGDDTFMRFSDRAGIDGTETLLADGLVKDQQLFLSVMGVNATTGRYALEVSYGNDVVGDFAEPNQNQDDAFPLYLPPEGELILPDLSIHNDADRDYFSFVAPENTDGTARIKLIPADDADNLNVSLRLLDSAGAAILTTDAAGPGEIETLNLTAGLESGDAYFIDVNGWSTAGEYQLIIETPVTAALTPVLPNKPTTSYRPNAYGMTSFGPLPSGGAQIKIVEEIGNPNDDDLSFGMTPVGSNMTGEVVILNTGGATLDITDIASDNAAFTVSDTTASIAAGASQMVTVTFTPTQMQLYSDATLTIAYGDSSEYTLALSGTGTVSTSKPDIAIADAQSSALSQIDFADTIADGASTMTFKISNTGASNLNVTSALITGADAEAFQIVQTNLANKSSDNYTITAGGQRSIQVKFLPAATGNHDAVLTLTSNDPDESSVQIPLAGLGVAPNLIVDLNPEDGTVANALNPLVAFGQQVADGAGGQTAQYPITLVNNGTTDLTISSITFNLENNSFSIEGDGIELEGFTLEAGQSIAATLVFDPVLSADMNGPAADTTAMADTMKIFSDDPDTPVMQFSLSGQAIEAYVESAPDGSHTFTYTEPDGDEVRVRFGKTGAANFTFDGESLDSVNLSSIVITGSTTGTSLIVTDTNSEGDGVINIGTITADGAFGTLSVQGNVTSFTAGGAVKKIDIDETLSGLNAGGTVSSLQVGTLTGTVTAGAFGTIDVEEMIADATITANDVADANIKKFNMGGTMNNSTVTAGEIGSFTANGAVSQTVLNALGGAVRKLNLKASADNLTVNTSNIGSLNVTGDLANSAFNATGSEAGIGKVKINGNATNTDFTADGPIGGLAVTGNLGGAVTTNNAEGAIKNISVGGNLTADVTAYDTIKNIKVGGNITSTLLHLIDAAGEASLNSLTAGGNVNIANLNVEGNLNKLNVGSKKSAGDLSGSLDVDDTLKSLRVYGDIEGDVTAGVSLGKVQATGSLMSEADLNCETGDIDSVQIGQRIYGTISANGGLGTVKKIDYSDKTFRDPDTELNDLPRNHIVANWTAPKSNASVRFGVSLTPQALRSMMESYYHLL